MKKEGLIILITLFFPIQWSCSDKSVDDGGDNTPKPDYVGEWDCGIGPIDMLKIDRFNIILNINENRTFLIELNQRSEKILYKSEGKWEATADSIFLFGRECFILDTLPDPDTLAPLADSLCGIPIPLSLPEKKEGEEIAEWYIETENLAVLLSAFPLDTGIVQLIPRFLPILPLEKKEK